MNSSGVKLSDEKESLIYNPKIRSIFFQILALVIVFGSLILLRHNTLVNLEDRGKSLGFHFLGETSGFSILPTFGTWVVGYEVGVSTYVDVFIIGILNTLAVGLFGIIAATLLGFTIGIFRLSNNFILRSFAATFVEIFRNIPLLLWLFIVYFAVLRNLPAKREALFFTENIGINITGLYAPAPQPLEGFLYVLIALIVGMVGCIFIIKWSTRRFLITGKKFPGGWLGLILLICLPLAIYYILGQPLNWEDPIFKSDGPVFRRGYQAGMGMMIVPEMIAVWAALSLYTAAFIAEIVRSGILAISYGQTEASFALGLRPGTTLRLVIIPQAMRVIVPPLTSQYLNLLKNSSLAVAIAYPELVSVFGGTALNQVGKEVEMIFMLMLVYLSFSIITSIFMNWFNSKIKLVER